MSPRPGALDGIRVLDFSRVFAGPDSTQILGDFGADVIKVEEPTRGDDARYFGATRDELAAFGGVSPSFLAFNRNKLSLALDLGCEAGRNVARRIAADVDVMLNNFRPGAMAKWGLGYDDLKTLNPRLVYATFYAYGAEGPLADFGANDLALQAHSGLMSITGEADRPPVRCGTAAIDLHASLGLVSAISLALFHRERTGAGQEVDTSLLLSSAHLMNYFYADYWISGNTHGRMGTANHLSVPNQAFPASDGMVIIIAPNDEMWLRCARALDAAALDRPEFECSSTRLSRRHEVVAALSAVTCRLSCAELVERLGAVKVNVAKVNDIGEAADHPQLAAVGGVVDYERHGRRVKVVGSPFRMAATPASVRRPAPEVGEHTDEVLAQFGLSEAEIADYRQGGAFGRAGSAASA